MIDHEHERDENIIEREKNNSPNMMTHEQHENTFYPLSTELLENSNTLKPNVDGFEKYLSLVQDAEKDLDGFWLRNAKELLDWVKPPTIGIMGDFSKGEARWFQDGILNVAHNCVDRHAALKPNKTALIWEGDEPGETRLISYGDLQKSTSQLANYLHSKGVKKGDSVTIYMPMVPEIIVAMLACARLGAVHNVVFAGFSAESLADRIVDSASRVVLTADEGIRGGKKIPLKKTVDAAIKELKLVETVLIYQRTGVSIEMIPGRDEYWHEEIPKMNIYHEPVPMNSNDPLFMLYTSGSTGKPKGLVHSSGGYLVYAMLTHKLTFDHHEGDIHGCLADLGWISGHTYILYGPLSNGATTAVFESTPVYPNASRYWDVVSKHHLTSLYTAPTVIRALMRHGDEPFKGYDLSSLRVLGSVGEPINPEAWLWYYERVGKGRCVLVDTYWQTETGGHIVTPLPGAIRTKAGSATLPFPGISLAVLDQHTGMVLEGGQVSGVLAISKPWPGQALTIHGDAQKFYQTYFQPYSNGYYFTGDRVYRDGDGYYWIRGRVDDVINVSAHRISTADVEAAISRHPLCAESAVLGRPDDVTGQSIWVFCILKPGYEELSMDQIQSEMKVNVRTAIGGFAIPKEIIICEDLPKTRSGKIMRRVLRKILEGVRNVSDLGDTSTLNNAWTLPGIITAVDRAESKSKLIK